MSKKHCTKCEIAQQNLELIAENNRLKEQLKEANSDIKKLKKDLQWWKQW